MQRTNKGKSSGLSPPARFHGKMGSGSKLDSASARCLFSADDLQKLLSGAPLQGHGVDLTFMPLSAF